jgi:hypothetical protein
MRLISGLLATAGCLLSAAAALAQIDAGDVRYCNALAQLYMSYVGPSDLSSRRGGGFDPEARLAIDTCRGNPQGAIPVLEKRLHNGKVNLPQRS